MVDRRRIPFVQVLIKIPTVLEHISQPEYDMFDAMGESPDSELDQNDRVISRLEKEMKAAASRLDFERAALIRDRITELREATN